MTIVLYIVLLYYCIIVRDILVLLNEEGYQVHVIYPQLSR